MCNSLDAYRIRSYLCAVKKYSSNHVIINADPEFIGLVFVKFATDIWSSQMKSVTQDKNTDDPFLCIGKQNIPGDRLVRKGLLD